MSLFIFLERQIDKKNDTSRSILEECTFLGTHTLTVDDRKQLNVLYPNYCFNHLSKFESQNRRTRSTNWEGSDIKLVPSNEYKKHGQTKKVDFTTDFLKFNISNDKYKDWISTENGIFFYELKKDIPKNLTKCEELFDKNVLEIKKLVDNIGELNEVVTYQQLNLVLYDDSNLIEPIFIQRFNKHIQIYGFISVPIANKKRNNLINSDNILQFNINHEINKEYLTLQVEHLESSGKVSTSDSKVHNFSILANKKTKN